MSRTSRKLIKPSRVKQLHDRAGFFQRLVDGAGDRKFAAKLQGLIDEYERGARLAAAETETPRTS